MNLEKLLDEDLIKLEATARDKDDVLEQIAALAKKSKLLKEFKEQEIYEKLKSREDISTTGFGESIAIPHCPLEGLSDFVIGALVVPDGVDFNSLDGQPTRIFIFIIVPQNKRNQHIRLLSKFANALKNKNNVQELLDCNRVEVFREILLRQIGAGGVRKKSEKYNQFTIIIQNEDIFDKVLHTVAQVKDCIPSVMDSENASAFLYKQPLFSGFYDEDEKQFSQLILAVVNESYANDLIRQLNMILDDYEDDHMAFWVQEIFYCNGSINI